MIDLYGIAASCSSKVAYATEKEARAVAVKCWRKRGTSLRAYPCDRCGAWHLTRQGAVEIVVKPGWRPPAKSQRTLARERKRQRRRR